MVKYGIFHLRCLIPITVNSEGKLWTYPLDPPFLEDSEYKAKLTLQHLGYPRGELIVVKIDTDIEPVDYIENSYYNSHPVKKYFWRFRDGKGY